MGKKNPNEMQALTFFINFDLEGKNLHSRDILFLNNYIIINIYIKRTK